MRPVANSYNQHLRVDMLSARQRLVLELVSKGLRNNEIANVIGCSGSSVKWYLSQLFLIFDVTNRTELVGVAASRTSDDELSSPTGS